jgi:predicted outer membrane repeat protein
MRVSFWHKLLVVCVLLSATYAFSATIYLKPDGNDGSDGSTWDLAKKTLAGALAAAGSGDVIIATNGTYTSTHFAIDWIRSGETVQSVNGPDYTSITKYDASMPCIRVEGTLDGFTVKDGSTSAAYKGGGIMLIGGVVRNCIITNCTAGGDGGGVYIDSGGTMSNCVISGNSASAKGGGASVKSGLLIDSTVIGNSASSDGGGVYIPNSTGECVNNIISHNTAGGIGGGAYLMIGADIRGCLVSGNESTGNGGGVHADGCTIESCTIVGNTSSGNGSGVYQTMGGSVLRNNIIYYNENTDAYLSMSITLDNSCYQTYVNSPSMSANDSFTNAPLFISRGSGYGTSHVAGNYMLTPDSPCKDTGLNQGWMTGAVDLMGTNRIENGTVNIGAYEGIGSGKDPQTITFAPIANQLQSAQVSLSATASSGLSVSFAVASGPASISGGNSLSFSDVGPVSVTASQAGDDTYEAAPDVTRSFLVHDGESFSLTSFALTNSAVVRWPDPYACEISNRTVMLRFNTSTYPATTADGTQVYSGTNRMYNHTSLTPGQTYYYSIFVSQDGSAFTNPP